MRKTIHKLFWAWDFDKEEKWLNEMSAKGLQLVAIGFCKYIFEVGEPGEYTVKLELLDNYPTHPQSEQYIKFIEETGAEYLGSILRWVYFRKKGSNFDLYSDIDSRIKHLKRILVLIGTVLALELYSTYSSLFRYLTYDNSTINLVFMIIVSAFSILIGFGFIRVLFIMKKLQKERSLHE